MLDKNLKRAIELLIRKCSVIPEKYTMYNGAYIFIAYPRDIKEKEKYMTPHYLVDTRINEAGVFSPVFDMEGFFRSAQNMKNI